MLEHVIGSWAVRYISREARSTNLISPCLVQVPGLEESRESSIGPIDERRLVLLKQVLPVTRRGCILLCIGYFKETSSHLSDTEVIISIFQRAGDAPRHRAKPDIVKVLDRNVVQPSPAGQPTATLVGPVIGLYFGVFLYRRVTGLPVNAIMKAFDKPIRENNIGVRASLGQAYHILVKSHYTWRVLYLCRETCGNPEAIPDAFGYLSTSESSESPTTDQKWSEKGSEIGTNPKDCL